MRVTVIDLRRFFQPTVSDRHDFETTSTDAFAWAQTVAMGNFPLLPPVSRYSSLLLEPEIRNSALRTASTFFDRSPRGYEPVITVPPSLSTRSPSEAISTSEEHIRTTVSSLERQGISHTTLTIPPAVVTTPPAVTAAKDAQETPTPNACR